MISGKSSRFSRRQFLQYTGLAASAALLAACPAPAQNNGSSSSGQSSQPAAAGKELEAWSQMTGIAQDSTKQILDN